MTGHLSFIKCLNGNVLEKYYATIYIIYTYVNTLQSRIKFMLVYLPGSFQLMMGYNILQVTW